ncbi:hypothetical protein [Microcoleus sp. FACHB-68]|uniref:hypothetical protein n=1 Tax=Microcoleus sp. FACHB-68 TaxID=2692826 RepID=UPI0016836B66|nr:hypothetical protein [Microcoleus sp. FACHB-68]MBD1939165.1 hypothetical protein [Microcoleus sp. FACHB-68]MBW4681860.1 hypothetical protein [Microcoleus vaginatus WJT46-NPBG5]
MSRSFNSGTAVLPYIFGIVLGLTVLVWLLRGFGILTFIPGSILWILILLSITTGIISRLQSRRGRY